jgi:hypothetical protein
VQATEEAREVARVVVHEHGKREGVAAARAGQNPPGWRRTHTGPARGADDGA